ncbi:MAG: bacillithiol system redox-active protein YtxJ [Bacteroidetes bacterium]|nr:bacillithiol system redox-active protein YtxJ [Bacteroidota bacterium]
MHWNQLESAEQLELIHQASFTNPQAIFKHSTRCNISSMAKMRLDQMDGPDEIPFYYLDLIQFRNISNEIADKWQVHHESPQLLIIRNGECVYEASHMEIRADEIRDALPELNP